MKRWIHASTDETKSTECIIRAVDKNTGEIIGYLIKGKNHDVRLSPYIDEARRYASHKSAAISKSQLHNGRDMKVRFYHNGYEDGEFPDESLSFYGKDRPYTLEIVDLDKAVDEDTLAGLY